MKVSANNTSLYRSKPLALLVVQSASAGAKYRSGLWMGIEEAERGSEAVNMETNSGCHDNFGCQIG